MSNLLSRAMSSGETTSEHAAMQSASFFGRILTIVGAVSGMLPQILEMANMLPDGVKDSKWGATGFAIVGGIVAILGVIKETAAKCSYISGRSLIKAAAVRDAAPSTEIPATPVAPPTPPM